MPKGTELTMWKRTRHETRQTCLQRHDPEHTALLGMAGPGKASLPLLHQASTHTHTQSCSRKCTLIDSLFLSLHTHTHPALLLSEAMVTLSLLPASPPPSSSVEMFLWVRWDSLRAKRDAELPPGTQLSSLEEGASYLGPATSTDI